MLILRATIHRLLWCVVTLGLAGALHAEEVTFDIPASTANVSIPTFAEQAGLQIVAPGEHLAGVATPAVSGNLEPMQALETLLAGTGLEVIGSSGRTITLGVGPGVAAARAAVPEQPSRPPERVPAGESGLQQPVEGQPDREPAPETETAPVENRLNKVTVTGTFLGGVAAESILPVTTLTREDIDLSGVTTGAELFSQLPQSAEFDNTETATGPNNARGDGASVNLRGLGSGNTLVLINGRRIAPFPISGGAVPRLSTNINQIPVGAIERVEVLRDGASSLYGSDAVAGVVNTILKKDYAGVKTNFRYGDVTGGSARELSGEVLAGMNFNEGRTNIMGFLSYFDRRSLTGTERDITADLRERAGSSNTRWDNRSVSGPFGQFTTGTANPDGSFTPGRTPGGAANGNFHTRPGAGGVETASGNLPRDLRFDFAPDFDLIPDTERFQLTTTLNHAFNDSIAATLEGFYYNADSVIANATAPISANADNGIFVPASNFHNPFGTRFFGPGTDNPTIAPQDVLLRNFRPLELGPRIAEVESNAYQVSGSVRGFVERWDWEAYVSYGKGKTTDIGRNMISESRLRQQLALDTPDAFNVFGGPDANSQAVLDAVRVDTSRIGETELGQAGARASVSVFDLPAGSLQAALGVEYRYEDFSDRRDEFTKADDVIALSVSGDANGSRSIRSGYLEFAVPLFSEANALPGLYRLDLSASVRTEEFSDFGRATKPKAGLAWSPIRSLLLRGSYNEGFRAPTLAQIFVGEEIRRNTGTPDPFRADVTATPRDLGDDSRQVIRGGNPDLGPEEAKSNSFGIVFEVPFVEGLSLSADYFRIRQNDVIDTFGEADQLALDFFLRTTGQGFNPNVVRLPVTPEDRAAFDAFNAANPGQEREAVGEVDFVRDTFINISRREVRGIDYGLAYRTPETRFGRFTISANVAQLTKFDSQRDAQSPTVSELKINGLPKTRGVANLIWRLNPIEFGLRANYISSFYDTSAPRDDDGSFFRVDSWVTFNSFVRGCFATRRLPGQTCARVGVNNFLDNSPPLADENRGFFETVHDSRGRFLFLELSHEF